MEDIYRILEALQGQRGRCVLATITWVEGSAYRKEGASMLFFEDGTQTGVLSSGCLEADIAARLPDVLAEDKPHMYNFDLDAVGPLSWGEGPGCGGKIQVMVVPVDDVLREHLFTVKAFLEEQIEVTLIRSLRANPSSTGYRFVTGHRHSFGEWKGEFPEAALEWAASGEPRKSGMHAVPEIAEEQFVHTYFPKPRLTIFGAGPDARPLSSFAAAAGFSVIVSDWRQALCERSLFPDVKALLLGFPDETAAGTWTPNDYVVVMSHHFEKDRELVRMLSGHDLAYMGVLGSKRRTQRLLEGRPVPANLHAPVGLAIGADGPVEIAVSIVAELIQVYRSNRKKRLIL